MQGIKQSHTKRPTTPRQAQQQDTQQSSDPSKGFVPAFIASDLDGTLLIDDKRVTNNTRTILQRITAAGIPFVVATGRPPRWVRPLIDGFGIAPLAVCANGAVIYDSATDRILDTHVLEPAQLEWLTDLTSSLLPSVGMAVERVGPKDHDAASSLFFSSFDYEHVWLNPDHLQLSDEDLIAAPAVKFLVRSVGLTSAEMVRVLQPYVQDKVDITYSTEHGLIEIAPLGISKASGVATIAQWMGISSEKIIAFGDMPNDLPLFEYVGHSVAMGNAHPDVLAAADEVTVSHQADGVAAVLSRWW